MTKYINKLTGVEQNDDQVRTAFECSLTWNGDCDPEEFLIEAYEDDFEDWLRDHNIEAIEVPDPVKPKKKATKSKANKKAKSNRVTAICDNTIPSFIQMFHEWHDGNYDAQELRRITLEVSKSLEENPLLVEEIITLYGNEMCAYYEGIYSAPTYQAKRSSFALDLIMTAGIK